MPKFDSVGFVAHVARQMRIKRWKPEEPKQTEQQPEVQRPSGLSPEEESELIQFFESDQKKE